MAPASTPLFSVILPFEPADWLRACAGRTALLVAGAVLLAAAPAPATAQEAEETTEVKPVSITPPGERPDLSVKAEVRGLSSEENSSADALKAGEEATLQVTVVNNGEQEAGRIEVWAAPETKRPGLRLQGGAASDTGAVRLGSVRALGPSTEVTFTGTLMAEDSVSGGRQRYSVEVQEENGFGPSFRPTVAVQTAMPKPPSLELKKVEVASGPGKLLPGEASEVRLEVRNTGPGPAREVEAKVTAGPGGTLAGRSRRVVGTLQPGEAASVSTPVSAEGAGGDVPLQVRLEDKSGRYGTTVEQSLPVATPVDRMIPETNTERPNAIAVVIGIKEYQDQDIPDVEYALRDAEVMKKYLTRALGFREENIIFKPNATGSALREIFGVAGNYKGQLHDYVKPGESDVFVYYSGHGAPAPGENKAYLVASNTNPNYLSINGYPAGQLYENLAQVPARSTTVVLEACFSGVSENGPIIQRASPVDLSVENPVMAMEDGLAFTAGAADQIASWYPEKKHGLFTYHFLKGLRGEADQNGDRAVTAAEMEQYLMDKVPYRARRMFSREQTPQVVGADKSQVLIQYE